VFRIWAVVSLLAGMLLLLVSPLAAQDGAPEVRILTIDDTITPPMAQYVERGISSAESADVDAIVLEIDTPGGLSSAMDDIDRAILESEVPVIAYVSPRGARAASAGVFITYASHVAAMAPGTSIGSASPVSSDGSDMSDTMGCPPSAILPSSAAAMPIGRNPPFAMPSMSGRPRPSNSTSSTSSPRTSTPS
jgi:membrane-bound serine protease (ClpP class)